MKTFKVEIQEILARVVEVKVNSDQEAVLRAGEMYRNEDIVLDYSDYISTEINVFPKKDLIDFDTLSNCDNF